jgi:hypothetical protein
MDRPLRSIALLSFVPLLTGGLCRGQTTDDAVPASTNVMGASFPEVHAHLRVTVRLKARDAKTVRLHMDRDYDLTKDDEGVERDHHAPTAGISLLLVYPGRRERLRSGESMGSDLNGARITDIIGFHGLADVNLPS